MKYSDYIVDIFVIHRHTRISFLNYFIEYICNVVINIYRKNRCPWNHDIPRPQIIELEHPRYHIPLKIIHIQLHSLIILKAVYKLFLCTLFLSFPVIRNSDSCSFLFCAPVRSNNTYRPIKKILNKSPDAIVHFYPP